MWISIPRICYKTYQSTKSPPSTWNSYFCTGPQILEARRGRLLAPQGTPMSSSAEQRDYWHCYVLPFIHTPTDNWPPCEQTLLMCSSWLKRRKGDSAWVVSSLWSCCSLKFWTSQSCFFWSNSFVECEYLFINKPLVITEPTVPGAWLLGLSLKLYPRNM